MKKFAIYCTDKPRAAQARLDARGAHFAHIEKVLEQIHVAGPLKDADGNITGSLLVVQANDEAEARAFLKADPYYAAGIWDSITITEFTAAAGSWIGGKIW